MAAKATIAAASNALKRVRNGRRITDAGRTFESLPRTSSKSAKGSTRIGDLDRLRATSGIAYGDKSRLTTSIGVGCKAKGFGARGSGMTWGFGMHATTVPSPM